MWLYTFVFDYNITLLVCGVLVGTGLPYTDATTGIKRIVANVQYYTKVLKILFLLQNLIKQL